MKNVKDFKTFINENEGTQFGAPQNCCSPEVQRMAKDLIECAAGEMSAYHNDPSHEGTAEDYVREMNEMVIEGMQTKCNEMMTESTPNSGSDEEAPIEDAPSEAPEEETPIEDEESEEEENEETY